MYINSYMYRYNYTKILNNVKKKPRYKQNNYSTVAVVESCMVDFITYSSRSPKPGETLIGYKFQQDYGGKGANQCVAAARLGASAVFIASLGSDSFGKEYLNRLKNENIDVSYIKLREDISTGIAQINVTKTGENNIIIVQGSNTSLSPDDIFEAEKKIKSASVLLLQFEIPLKTILTALKIYKGHGISIVNGAPALKDVDPEIFKLSDIFCVNEVEAKAMTGYKNVSIKNAQEVADKFLSFGCHTIIITFGPEGSVHASEDDRNIKHTPADIVKAVDTTGSGDAFLGALAYYIAHHPDFSLEKIVKRANKIATKTVLKTGTQGSFYFREELPDNLFL